MYSRYKQLIVVAGVVVALASHTAVAELTSKNSSDPVEITADTLEVLQEKHQAVFSGTVEAVQDKMHIRADKMTVHYRDAKNKEAGQDSVAKIVTDGHVFLSSPKETAQGDAGVYDVDAKTVTLTGNVVLTSGKNVVKGDKVVYNITTGQSQMVSKTKGSSNKKERVRGVFVPEHSGKR